MTTIFDELADFGYSASTIDFLKGEWFSHLSEKEISAIFVNNERLKYKLMYCVPRDASADGDASEWRSRWIAALKTDARWLHYHPFFRDSRYVVKYGVRGSVIDPRDGREYKTIQLNTLVTSENGCCEATGSGKVWLAENLDFDNHGGFYNYDEVYEAVIPGWHLPTLQEVADLEMFCNFFVGEKASSCLKAKKLWEGEKLSGTDAIGFNALPLGYIDDDGDLVHEGNMAVFWLNKMMMNAPAAVSLSLYNNGFLENVGPASEKNKLTIRLVKDNSRLTSLSQVLPARG